MEKNKAKGPRHQSAKASGGVESSRCLKDREKDPWAYCVSRDCRKREEAETWTSRIGSS